MAQSIQAAADALGVKLKMHAKEIGTAQDAIDFLNQASNQLESKG